MARAHGLHRWRRRFESSIAHSLVARPIGDSNLPTLEQERRAKSVGADRVVLKSGELPALVGDLLASA